MSVGSTYRWCVVILAGVLSLAVAGCTVGGNGSVEGASTTSTLPDTTSTTTPTSTTTSTVPMSTTTSLPFDPPAVIVATPDPALPGEVVEICAGFTDHTVSAVEFRDSSGYSAVASLSQTTQSGARSGCWQATVPTRLSSRTSNGRSYHDTAVGTHRLIAQIDDDVVVGEGVIGITDPVAGTGEGPPPRPWTAERYLIGQPLPIAISASSSGWNLVVPHGALDEMVDVASPGYLGEEYPSQVHLWTDPDAELALSPSELFSFPTGLLLWREFDFEIGDLPMVEDALEIGRPVLSDQFVDVLLALRSTVDRSIVPHRQYFPDPPSTLTSSMSAYSERDGYTYSVSVLEWPDESAGSWTMHTEETDTGSKVTATNGRLEVALAVSSIPPTRSPEDLAATTDRADVDELPEVLDALIAQWQAQGPIEHILSREALRRSLMANHVEAQATDLFGTPPGSDFPLNPPPKLNATVFDENGMTVTVTTEDPVAAARTLDHVGATIDYEGTVPVFITPATKRFFCWDTSFRVSADITFVRDLAAAVCAPSDPSW